VNLPLLNKGDQVVIHHVGAYNMTQWMQFITLRPRVVMIDMDGNPHIIREKEILDSVMKAESTPDHLR
jgi:diaminopimelate decarboxylase